MATGQKCPDDRDAARRLRARLSRRDERRQYVVKVTGYRKQFVNTTAEPMTAMQ